MLENGELCGADRSIIKRFFPENFLVATPIGLMRKVSNGGVLKGPIMKPDSTSFLIRLSTVSGSASADWRLLLMMLCESGHVVPGLKPCLRPDNR